jgi:hypothetical protein
MTPRVALIGFGEVGQILGRDLAEQGFDDISAYDRLFLDPISAPSASPTTWRRPAPTATWSSAP